MVFDIYASLPLRGAFDVAQSSSLVARYHFIEAQLARVMAGKLADVPEWEAKCLLGRHLWQDALHANGFQQRLEELRWPRKAPLHPGQELVRVMSLLDETLTTASLLAGIYRVIKPRLIAAYAAHINVAAPLADEPTCVLMRQTLREEQEQIAEGLALLDSLAGAGPTMETRAWQTRLEEACVDAGSWCAPRQTAPREVPGHFEGYAVRPAPPIAARDSRFQLVEDGFPAFDTHDAEKFMAHRDADNEMHAAEVLGRNLYEHPEMPWEFHVDMARQCWDEVRHAVLYQKYLEEIGGRLGDYAVVPGNYAYRMALEFPHRLYDLHLRGEKLGMPDLIRMRGEALRDGNHSYALLNDYIHADEVPHVKNGRWLNWLLKDDQAAFKQVEIETMQRRAAYEQAHAGDPLLQAYTGLSQAILRLEGSPPGTAA